MSVKKYILYVLVLTGIIALAGYYYFGGFEETELQLVEVNDYHLAGKYYKGTLSNKQLEDIFFEVRRQYEKGEPAGTFSIVVLKEPETAKDTVEQFIGIILQEPVAASSLPAGWESLHIKAGQAVRSTIRSHNLVMPKPFAIKEEIKTFAQAQNLKLNPAFTIEKYLGERHLEIEIPVAE